MTGGPNSCAAPTSRRLTPDEIAMGYVLARKVGLGSSMAVIPVRQADVGNRVLEATRELLEKRGFPVVAIRGGSDNVLKAALSLTAAARSEASKKNNTRPIVLVVKDAHLLSAGRLYLLAEFGNMAVVAAPVVEQVQPQKMASRRFARIASMLVGAILASLATSALLLPAAQRAALEDRAARLLASMDTDVAGSRGGNGPAEMASRSHPTPPSAPSPPSPGIESTESTGAPGLLIKARAGDTLEALYLRIYRGVPPPPFASVVALNPETIRPGDILTFPAPVNGWSGQHQAGTGSSIR